VNAQGEWNTENDLNEENPENNERKDSIPTISRSENEPAKLIQAHANVLPLDSSQPVRRDSKELNFEYIEGSPLGIYSDDEETLDYDSLRLYLLNMAVKPKF
jgi:hypothetical protein